METEFTPISEQAAHWWVTLHHDTCTAAERRAFAEWIAKSPERVEAYLRVTLLNQALVAKTESGTKGVQWPDTSAEQLIQEARAQGNVETLTPALSQRERGEDEEAQWREELPSSPLPLAGEGRVRVRSLRPLALAASALLVLAGGWFFLASPQRYHTDLGEQHSVLLADGSLIMLNTSSEIEVDLSKDHRRIRLLEGEALFQVAHDSLRPFDVIAGNATIRAVGTQFNVDRRAAQTTVTVIEGRVLVDRSDEPGSIPVVAAERVIVTAAKITAPERVATAPITAWTQRRLVFERRPLGEVAEEFNRYNRTQIRIDDAELKRQEVTGVFEANDSESFITFLKQIPNVRIDTTADGTLVVTVVNPVVSSSDTVRGPN